MSCSKQEFFSDLLIKDSDDLDLFLERLKALIKYSSENAKQASMLAFTILETVSTVQKKGFLDSISDSLGLWNNSEVFILEKRLSECEIVQAGILPEGALISFKNEYN